MSAVSSPRVPLSHNARVLIVGTACITIILGGAKGIPHAMRRYSEASATLAGTGARLAARQHVAAERQRIAQARERSEGALMSLSPAFLKGDSPSQGAATLASVVADAGEANGVQLTSLQPEADSAATPLVVPVTVRVSGNGDVGGITGMLHDLESGAPLLEVRQLTIGQSEPAAPHDRMETLHIELTVRGLYRRVPGDPDGGLRP